MRNRAGLLLLLCLFTACSRPAQQATEQTEELEPLWNKQSHIARPDTHQCPKIVALLIAVGDYPPTSGWERLSARNDMVLMRQILHQQGVVPCRLHTLVNQQATRAGIVRALLTLADTVQRGSQVIILYGGHAHQLPDNNGDESDGFDEAIVPFDAPPARQNAPGGYLRDDDLNQYFTRIRTRLGPAGSLWLLFDACHSQTLHRGQAVGRGPQAGLAWLETLNATNAPAPFALFAATADNAPNFEVVDAVGKPIGPLTRAVAETWNQQTGRLTYRQLFDRVVVAMARFAPYQQPALEGDSHASAPGCGLAEAPDSFYQTRGEPVRINWPRTDKQLTDPLAELPFVRWTAESADLRVVARKKGYDLLLSATGQLLTPRPLSAYACADYIRQFFARSVLLNLRQSAPGFRVETTLQRVAVRAENGQIVVADTLPNQLETGVPVFYARPGERVVLTFTNVGTQPCYLTVVDLLPDGRFQVLLPEANALSIDYRLMPGQSLRRRVRITEPFGAEVYKLLLTPTPIDLRAVWQMRGNIVSQHPYEALVQRTYALRGLPETPAALSDQAGATADVAFWVKP